MDERAQAVDGDGGIDARRFRDLLGCFTTGVTVVTARAPDGQRLGMTVSSFNSVSLAPPLVLFSVDRRASGLEGYRLAAGYAVNVLSRDQLELATRFARSGTDKWEGVAFREGLGGAPVLEGSLAHLECRPYAVHDGGDHEIFVLEVVRLAAGAALEPLVFYRGRLRGLGEEYDVIPDWHLAYYYSR